MPVRPHFITVYVAVLIGAFTTMPGLADEPEETRSQRTMENVLGALVGKEGARWRTPNPDFADDGTTPAMFEIRWRWDRYKQYAIGELLGIFDSPEGEKTVPYWDLYAWFNPVTGEITGMQIGWDGSMASGPMRLEKDGRIILDQILYGSDGSLKAIRHEEILHPEGESYRSRVYERGDDGEWTPRGQWTWSRVR